MAFVKKKLESFARGDTWTTKFTIKDSDNVAIDITGYTYWMTLKENRTDADPGIAQVSAVAGSPDATSGIVFITFPDTITSVFSALNYHYDLQQVDNQSPPVISTLLIGRVKCVEDITRSTA